MFNWLAPATKVIDSVAGAYGKRQERKGLKEQAKIKAAVAKQAGEQQVTLTDAEWESLSVEKSDSTWKDEYLTVVVPAAIPLILAGAIVAAVTGDSRLLTGVTDGVDLLMKLFPNFEWMVYAVVTAGVGLKIWRGPQ